MKISEKSSSYYSDRTEKILTFQCCTYKVHKKQLTNTCIRPFDVRHFGHNHHSSAMRMIDMNICRFIWIWCCRFWIWLNEIMPQSSMKLNISRIYNVCVCVYLVGQSKWIFRQLFKNWILWTKHLILFAAQQTIHNEKKPILALVRHFTLAMCSLYVQCKCVSVNLAQLENSCARRTEPFYSFRKHIYTYAGVRCSFI